VRDCDSAPAPPSASRGVHGGCSGYLGLDRAKVHEGRRRALPPGGTTCRIGPPQRALLCFVPQELPKLVLN